MIYLSKWLIRKYPNVLLVLAGISIAAIPISWGLCVEAHVLALHVQPTGLDAFLYDLRNLRYIERAAVGAILLGLGISLTGMFRMIRYDS